MFRKNYSILFIIMLAIAGCAGASQNVSNTTDSREIIHEDIEGVDLSGISHANSGVVALFKACNSSHINLSKVRKLITSGVDVNTRITIGEQQLTPLGVACNRSDIDAEAVRVLIELGAKVDARSLITFNRHLESSTHYYATPLELACDRSDIDIEAISVLLEHGAKLQDDTYTVLDIVCNRSKIDTEAVRMLVEHGADINAFSKSGMTPLMIACNRSDIDEEALRVLIELGANLYLGSKPNDDTAVMIASDRHAFDKKAVAFLLDSGSDVRHRAKNGTVLLTGLVRDLDLMKKAIQMGADTYVKDDERATLLHYAAVWGSPESVSFLMELGLDIEAKTKNGMTPLNYAALGNNLDVVRLLVEAGADIHNMDQDQQTGVLSEACFAKRKQFDAVTTIQPDVVKYFIDHGADVNQADKYGWTPLFYAVNHEEDTTAVVEMLLNAGAVIARVDNAERSVLDYVKNENVRALLLSKVNNALRLHGQLFDAVKAKDMDKIRELVEAGVNVNERGDLGRTPIWYATSLEMARYLVEHGANLNIIDQYKNCLVTHFIGYDYQGGSILNYSRPTPVDDDRVELLIYLMEHGAKPGKGDVGDYASSKKESLSLAGVASHLKFRSKEQWDRFRKLYVTADTVNLFNGGIENSLLYATMHQQKYGRFELSSDPDEIIHLLDLGARVYGESRKGNLFAEYLGAPDIEPSKEVVQKFLEVIPSNLEGHSILNSYYIDSAKLIPTFILVIQKLPELVPAMLAKGANPNAQIIIDESIQIVRFDLTYEDVDRKNIWIRH